MHRIDTPSRQKDKFGAGKDGFTQGDPQTGTPATQVSADFLDSIQEEIAAVIEDQDSGDVLDKSKTNQMLTAIKGIIRSAGMQATELARGGLKVATQLQMDAGAADDAAATPKKLVNHYRKNNILGPVSQLAGVPTGAIIESGSNANGEYIKFANGLMICMIRAEVNHNVSVPSAWGTTAGIGYVPSDLSWTFPAPFVQGTIPLGWGNPEGRYSHGGATSHLSQINNVGAQKRSWMNAPSNIIVNFFAIGKWY